MISKNDRYGAQKVFLDQVSALHSMGNRVVVAGRGTSGYVPETVQAMGVTYYGISMSGVKDLLYLRQLVKNDGIDIIHTTLDRADYFGVLLSKLTRKPVVSTMMVPRYHPGFKLANKVVVLSEMQKRLLQRKGIKTGKISVIRPGIDVARFAGPDPVKREAWKRRLDTDKFDIIFCHVSSLIPRKAHMVSLELAAECMKRGESPLLVIIGDPVHGEYHDSLVRRIAELGLSGNAAFTGWTSEIPEILSLSHFTVLPSENEALGIVLMEGMAAGTPIVAREGEGGAELIEEYGTGFLYRPDEGVSGLADRLVKLRKDPVQYKALSEKCKKAALGEFTKDKLGQKLVDLYRALIRT